MVRDSNAHPEEIMFELKKPAQFDQIKQLNLLKERRNLVN